MVPSAAMGRDIPVAFQAGGPHAVFLLDAFNAGPDVSNWVTAGNAMNTLAGKGISVAAPAGGAWSMYTDWEQDGSKQWETFLSSELPDWLAANKGLAPGGHGIVGAAQGGTGALTLAAFHPDRFRYAGSLSGFLTPSATTMNGAITAGLAQFGGVDTATCGVCRSWAAGSGTTPTCTSQLLADNNTRLWVFSPADAGVQRSRRDDRLLRSGPGQQPHVLSALPRPSAATTVTSTSRPAASTTGAAGARSWRDVRRPRRRHQVVRPSTRVPCCPRVPRTFRAGRPEVRAT